MFRIILPGLLAIASCAEAPPPSAPILIARAHQDTDPGLLEIFFGAGTHREISPVIRCPVRCRVVQ